MRYVGYELNALIGAAHLLRECKPVLLIEADCKHLLRSIMAQLDNLGYVMAWSMVPAVDLTHIFHGISIEQYDEFFDSMHGPLYINGGHYMFAIPKSQEYLLELPEMKSRLHPIDFKGGKYYIEEYQINFCSYRSSWCFQKSHHGTSDGNEDRYFCNDERISDYLRLYWEKFA
jgi:hypothetical protein